jgi:nucleotide-binding universal stress UspA family protein
MILGSVGQTILAESRCSVRIARAPYGPQPGGLRIILAVDGSTESNAAVKVVASRNWPSGTSVHIVATHEHKVRDTEIGLIAGPTAVGSDYDDIDETEDRAATALAAVRRAGLAAQSIVVRGNPSNVILEEAERWAADMIFMGARGHRLLERILIGSVSNAVATRAHCSVEVVREHR